MSVLSNILPFTEKYFFAYMLVAVLFLALLKTVFRKKVRYEYGLALTSVAYLVLMYPKPLQIFGLILYCYAIYYFLGRRLKLQGLLFPVILLALPMVFMKTLNIIPAASDGSLVSVANIFQIAGLSFLTFKVIQLYIDEKDGERTVSLLRFFNFTAFVPTLLIGPIDRYARFTGNVARGYENMTSSLFMEGLDKFVRGLLYKFIIGEAIHQLILEHLVNDGSLLYHLSYMYGYLFYLFFDFAGYSLLAIGFGNMVGVDVPFNFDKPFLAVNPKEFWKRWHKTLGDWLNDYFFKPVFKELTTKKVFKPIQRQNIALFLTFTVMGFWNGFELHFILSGMLFGLYSMVHNYYVYRCKKNGREVFFGKLGPKAVKYLSIFLMFNLVAFAIYIFSGKLIAV